MSGTQASVPPAAGPPISVVLADDEALVRSGLAAILGAEPDIAVVGEAGDGAEVVSQVAALRPDVVLMDVRMPRIDGIEATRTITGRWPDRPKIIILTTFSDDEYVLGAMESGAAGFVLKRASGTELAQAVRTVHRGDALLFPQRLRELFRRGGSDPAAAARYARLTPREDETLRLMTDGATNAEIAAALVVSVETVKSHVAAVLGKLGARDRTQAVVYAYRDRYVVP